MVFLVMVKAGASLEASNNQSLWNAESREKSEVIY